MRMLKIFTIFTMIGSLLGTSVPRWSPSYSVQGMLSIPFAEIEEPFNAWADLDQKKSRIDYYGGMVKTFQRGDLDTTAKVFLGDYLTKNNIYFF